GPGRYGLRCPGGPRRLPGPPLLVDRPVQPRARPGRPEGAAAQGAFAPEGSVESGAAGHQARPGSGRIRRVSTAVAAPDRAESEASDVLRPSGKAAGPLRRGGPARLFDNEEGPRDGRARRCEDPDDE